jgi:hypothetical protein
MKNNNSNTTKLFIYSALVLALIFVSSIASAQSLPPPVPPVPPGVPFGAVEFLLVGLAGYGVKKYRDSKK